MTQLAHEGDSTDPRNEMAPKRDSTVDADITMWERGNLVKRIFLAVTGAVAVCAFSAPTALAGDSATATSTTTTAVTDTRAATDTTAPSVPTPVTDTTAPSVPTDVSQPSVPTDTTQPSVPTPKASAESIANVCAGCDEAPVVDSSVGMPVVGGTGIGNTLPLRRGYGNRLPYTGISDIFLPILLGLMVLAAGLIAWRYATVRETVLRARVRASEAAAARRWRPATGYSGTWREMIATERPDIFATG